MIARSIVLDRRRVERLDREQPRLGHVDRRDVLERRRRPVVVDLDPVEQRRRGAAGPDGVEVLVGRVDRLVHPLRRVAHEVVDSCHSRHLLRSASRSASRRSRRRRPARCCPGASSNTWMGRLLSMQSESAVVSITFRPRSIACEVRDRRQERRRRDRCAGRRRRHRGRRSWPSGSPRRRSRAPAAPPRCRS